MRSKQRTPRRKDGFKKAGSKVRVKSKIEVLELDLYINPESGQMMLIVGTEEFQGDLASIKKRAGDYLDARTTLTWQRYIGIHYYAESGEQYGRQHRHGLDDEAEEVIKGIQFQFEVFDLSSPINLDENHVARSYRYNNKEQERRKRDLRRNEEDTDWERNEYQSGMYRHDGEQSVDVDYVEDKDRAVYVEYSEERYAGVCAIRDALIALDRKMRTLLKSDDLPDLLVAMKTHGLLGDGS